MLAGVDDPYGAAAPFGGDSAGPADATLAAEGSAGATGDGASTAEDVQIPQDVYTPDANEAPPDAAEAGCKNPTGPCNDSNSACCVPAVCNAVAKCVGQCVSGLGCGDEAACCFGKHCSELFNCQDTCGGDKAPCSVPSAVCCQGSVCPLGVAAPKCQKCIPVGGPCMQLWECCTKNCGTDRKCH
jgi:hypothetical protein